MEKPECERGFGSTFFRRFAGCGPTLPNHPTMPPVLRKMPSNIIFTAWALLAFS